MLKSYFNKSTIYQMVWYKIRHTNQPFSLCEVLGHILEIHPLDIRENAPRGKLTWGVFVSPWTI
jgi:hypothetical protein